MIPRTKRPGANALAVPEAAGRTIYELARQFGMYAGAAPLLGAAGTFAGGLPLGVLAAPAAYAGLKGAWGLLQGKSLNEAAADVNSIMGTGQLDPSDDPQVQQAEGALEYVNPFNLFGLAGEGAYRGVQALNDPKNPSTVVAPAAGVLAELAAMAAGGVLAKKGHSAFKERRAPSNFKAPVTERMVAEINNAPEVTGKLSELNAKRAARQAELQKLKGLEEGKLPYGEADLTALDKAKKVVKKKPTQENTAAYEKLKNEIDKRAEAKKAADLAEIEKQIQQEFPDPTWAELTEPVARRLYPKRFEGSVADSIGEVGPKVPPKAAPSAPPPRRAPKPPPTGPLGWGAIRDVAQKKADILTGVEGIRPELAAELVRRRGTGASANAPYSEWLAKREPRVENRLRDAEYLGGFEGAPDWTRPGAAAEAIPLTDVVRGSPKVAEFMRSSQESPYSKDLGLGSYMEEVATHGPTKASAFRANVPSPEGMTARYFRRAEGGAIEPWDVLEGKEYTLRRPAEGASWTEKRPTRSWKDIFRVFGQEGSISQEPIKRRQKRYKESRNQRRKGGGAAYVKAARRSSADIHAPLERLDKGIDRILYQGDWENPIQPRSTTAETLRLTRDIRNSLGETMHDLARGFVSIGRGWYKVNPRTGDTSFNRLLGEFQKDTSEAAGRIQYKLDKLYKQLDYDTGNALTAYIEAGGNLDLLRHRATTARQMRPKDTELHIKYDNALKVEQSPHLKAIAQDIRAYYDGMMDEGMKLGFFHQGVRNYVNHIWGTRPKNPVAQELIGWAETLEGLESTYKGSGFIRKQGAFMKQRVWDSAFQAEMHGWKAKHSHIGELIGAYHDSFTRAWASRKFVGAMSEQMASDGRPMIVPGGAVRRLDGVPNLGDITVIRTSIRPKDAGDYIASPYPELRRWKWIGKDEKGRPIYYEGDVLVHPEVFKRLDPILRPAWIDKHPVMRRAAQMGAELKATMLSMSGFHQVQTGTHAISHLVNPFAPRGTGIIKDPHALGGWRIDIDSPLVQDGLRAGLRLFDMRPEFSFSEGVQGGGLFRKVPFAGYYINLYNQYLFRSYIPRLKISMYEHALKRNRERYTGKLSDWQIRSLTADQANAAFGGLNWEKMGISKGWQQGFRLSILAPDFLIARGQFAYQAFKPYIAEGVRATPWEVGKGIIKNEQFMALMARGAVAIYAINRILSALLDDGDPHFETPFGFVFSRKNAQGHKERFEVSLRSVPADVYHLLSEPHNFWTWRLNPVFLRPALDWVTQVFQGAPIVDTYGLKLLKEHAVNVFLPIPVKGPIDAWRREDDMMLGAWRTVLGSIGANIKKNHTLAEQALFEVNKGSNWSLLPYQADASAAKRNIRRAIAYGVPISTEDRMRVTDEQFEKIMKNASVDAFQGALQTVPLEGLIQIAEEAHPGKWTRPGLRISDIHNQQFALLQHMIVDKLENGKGLEAISVANRDDARRRIGLILSYRTPRRK